jgi:hypothetical protein
MVQEVGPSSGNFCHANVGNLAAQLIKIVTIWWAWPFLGGFSNFGGMLNLVCQLLLFVFLFSIFMDRISEFLATLSGIAGKALGRYAKGSVDLRKPAATMVGKPVGAVGSLGKKGVAKAVGAVKKARSGGEGGEGGGGGGGGDAGAGAGAGGGGG